MSGKGLGGWALSGRCPHASACWCEGLGLGSQAYVWSLTTVVRLEGPSSCEALFLEEQKPWKCLSAVVPLGLPRSPPNLLSWVRDTQRPHDPPSGCKQDSG